MADIFCNFTIPAGVVGGKLGGGFTRPDGRTLLAADEPPPSLMGGGNLNVTVTYPGLTGAPQRLTGVFVFSAALRSVNQSHASPFLGDGGRTRCMLKSTADKVSRNGDSVYTFAPIAYTGGRVGFYELTFCAANNEVTPRIQWAEDPEFDTGN